MIKANTPVLMWCFCYNYTSDLLSLCGSGRYDIESKTAYEAVMNYTPDISDYAPFS